MKGGSLCAGDVISLDPEFTNGHLYTLGDYLDDGGETIRVDATDENIIIKSFYKYDYRCKNEGNILKLLNNSDFTPKYYGTYACEEPYKIVYVVMERIIGRDLLALLSIYINNQKKDPIKKSLKLAEISMPFVVQYIDEIYRLYNVMFDRGIINLDLYLQNIILGDNGQLYFIDFEFAVYVGESIPLEYRLTIEQLLENLVNRKSIHKPHSYLTRLVSIQKGLGKYKKKLYNSKKIHKKKRRTLKKK